MLPVFLKCLLGKALCISMSAFCMLVVRPFTGITTKSFDNVVFEMLVNWLY